MSSRRNDIIRWGVSGLTVLVCYAAAATAILAWEPHYEPPTAPLTVAMIDLVPLPPDPTPPPPPAPPPPPLPEVIPEAPPEVKVEVPLPPVKKPPPPKVKKEEPPPEIPPPPSPSVETAAVPPTPAPPRISAPARNAVDPFLVYQARITQHVQASMRYPAAAKKRGETGRAMVWLKIDRSGKVLSARLESGSRWRMLDEEAVAAVKRADPVPAVPAEIAADQPLEFVLPLDFLLQ